MTTSAERLAERLRRKQKRLVEQKAEIDAAGLGDVPRRVLGPGKANAGSGTPPPYRRKRDTAELFASWLRNHPW